ADLQRLDGTVHRRLAEPPGGGKSLTEAHDARKRVDDAELARPRRHRDEQSAIVGAEIERRVDRQVALSRRPRLGTWPALSDVLVRTAGTGRRIARRMPAFFTGAGFQARS